MNNHVLYEDTCSFQLQAHTAIYNIRKLQLATSNTIVADIPKLEGLLLFVFLK